MLDDFFENYFKIEKAYRRFFRTEMEKYHLTPNELLVLLFLSKGDGASDTARDIARYEGVSKGLVARSVESLSGKHYLAAERDGTDKRISHLHLTQSCGEMIEQITEKKKNFFRELMKDIPAEDIKVTEKTLRKFMENIGLGEE